MSRRAEIILVDAILDLPQLMGENIPVRSGVIQEQVNEIPKFHVEVQPVEINFRNISKVAAAELVGEYYKDLLNHVQFGDTPPGFNPTLDGRLRIREMVAVGEGQFQNRGSWTFNVVLQQAEVSVSKGGVSIALTLAHEAALTGYYNPGVYSKASAYAKTRTGLRDGLTISRLSGTQGDRMAELLNAFNTSPVFRQFPGVDRLLSNTIAQFTDQGVNALVFDRALAFVRGAPGSDDLTTRFTLPDSVLDLDPGINNYIWNTLTRSSSIVEAVKDIVNMGFNGFLAYKLDQPVPHQFNDTRRYVSSGRRFLIPMKSYQLSGGNIPRNPTSAVFVTATKSAQYGRRLPTPQNNANPNAKFLGGMFPPEPSINGDIEQYDAPPWFMLRDTSDDEEPEQKATNSERIPLRIAECESRVDKFLRRQDQETTDGNRVMNAWAEALFREHAYSSARCNVKMPLNLFSQIVGERIEIETDVDDPRAQGQAFTGFTVSAVHRFGSGQPSTSAFTLTHLQYDA